MLRTVSQWIREKVTGAGRLRGAVLAVGFILVFASGCAEKNLTQILGSASVDSVSISGSVASEQAFAQKREGATHSKAIYSSSTCLSGSNAHLYNLKAGGGLGSRIATSPVDLSTGQFSFNLSNKPAVNLADLSKVQYLIQVISCSGEIQGRPVTGTREQNVTSASSLLAFALGSAPAASASASQFSRLNSKDILQLMVSLDRPGVSLVSATYDHLVSDLTLSSQFQSVVGFEATDLVDVAPIVTVTSPTARGKELISYDFSVSVYHWYSFYTSAVSWALDGVTVGSGTSYSYVPSKNSQGEHSLTITVGRTNGSGGVDTTKPTFVKVVQFKVDDTYPATPLSFAMSAPVAGTEAATRDITLSLTTGAAFSECATFSKFLITENDVTPPIDTSAFVSACSTQNTQTVSHRLGFGNGTRVLRLWVIDSSGNISVTPTLLSLNLTATAPTLSMTAPVTSTYVNSSQTSAFAVSGTCSANGRAVTVTTSRGNLTSVVTCTASIWSTTFNLTSVTDGSLNLTATHSNSDDMPSAAFATVTKDTVLPTVTMTTPTTASIVSAASMSAYPFSGTCSEAARTVSLQVVSTAVTTTTTCGSNLTWSTTMNLSSIADGAFTLQIDHTDAAANSSAPVSVTLSKNSTVPTLSVDPVYRGGEAATLTATSSTAIQSLKLQWASDGVTFSDVGTFAGALTSIPWTVPSSSTSLGKLKLIATDQLGATVESTTGSIRILSESALLAGDYAANGAIDGSALIARVHNPLGMAKIGSMIYLTNTTVLRKIDLTDPANPIVSTIAGRFGQALTLDGIGTAARFNNLSGVTTDGTYLYAVDYNDNVVRKINPQTGEVTTFAGQAGVTGTVDGLGSAATLTDPWGILYVNGNLYISSSRTIRKVTLAGDVTTFAGSQASGGTVNHPTDPLQSRFLGVKGLASDGSKLYIADTSSYMIRAIDFTTGETTTVAGQTGALGWTDKVGTAASFSSIDSLVYHAGALYIGDGGAHVIRKIDLTDSSVSTVVGVGGVPGDVDGLGAAARMFRPAHLVVNGADELLVTDYYNHKVSKFTPSTGAIQSLIGAPAADVNSWRQIGIARLHFPRWPTVSGSNIFFVEAGSATLRKYDITTNEVSWVAGNPGQHGATDGPVATAEFKIPSGVAIVGADYYIADDRCVRRISAGMVTTIAGLCGTTGNVPAAGTTETGANARFGTLKQIIAVGNSLYLVDYGYHKIRKIDVTDPANPLVSTFAGSSSGNINATGTSARFRNPIAITYNGADFYVLDYAGHLVRKMTTGAVVTTLAGTYNSIGATDGIGAAARFNYPIGIVADATYAYVGEANNHAVRRVTLATGEVTTLFGGAAGSTADGVGTTSSMDNPGGLILSGGSLYIFDFDTSLLRKADLTTLAVSTVVGNASLYGYVNGQGLDATKMRASSSVSSGTDVYVADAINHVIWKVNSLTGAKSVYAGAYRVPGGIDGALATARLQEPTALLLLSGSLYFLDYTSHTLRKIDLTTEIVSTVAGTLRTPGVDDGIGTAAKFNLPSGLETDGVDLYVSDSGNHLIRKVVLSTGAVTTIAGTSGVGGSLDANGLAASFNNPVGLSYLNGVLFIADNENYTIRKLDLASGVVTTVAGTVGVKGFADGVGTAAAFTTPSGLTNDGRAIYIADRANYAIRRLDPVTGSVTTWWGQSGQGGHRVGTFGTTNFGTVSDLNFSSSGLDVVVDNSSITRIR